MYGLSQAAIEEGLIAKGLELTVNQLEPGNIVYLVQNGEGHFSVITSITSTTVYLADSNLGNINMTRANFTSYYSGYALIVTNDTGDSQLSMGRNLSSSEMWDLVGSDWIYFGNGSPWYFHVPENSIGRSNIHVTEGYTFTQTQYIDFYGTDYSTMYYSITAHYWGDYAGYLMKVTYNVYALPHWTGGIIYSGTQYVLLTHSANSQTISFTTPTMDGRSGDWVIGYMPLESLDVLPTGYNQQFLGRTPREYGAYEIIMGGAMCIGAPFTGPFAFASEFFGAELLNHGIHDCWGPE